MSIHDELMSRLGSHRDHTREVRYGSKLSIETGLDSPNFNNVYQPASRFNYRYELRHARRIDLSESPDKIGLSRQLLEEWYQMASNDDSQPFEIWSDPDTNDQICRLLLEAPDGSYDYRKVEARAVRLGAASINDFRQAGRRYVNAGIFLIHRDDRFYTLNLRICGYYLPFSVQTSDDADNDISDISID